MRLPALITGEPLKAMFGRLAEARNRTPANNKI